MAKLALPIIDRNVEPKIFSEPAALLIGSCAADHVTAFDFGDLRRNAADCACGGGDEHVLAVLECADDEQAAISGKACQPEHAHVRYQRHAIGIELQETFAVGQ